MNGSCSACGRSLVRTDPSWVVQIEVFAAADPLEMDEHDLVADLDEELRRLRESLDALDPETALSDVYSRFRYRLCRPCRDRFVADPSPRAIGAP